MSRCASLAAGIAVLGMAVAVAVPVPAHVPITGIGGSPIRWPGATVKFLLHPLGSDDVADGSDLLALRLAFARWTDALAGGLALQEATGPSPSSHDVDDLATHRVVFDENDVTGYFPVKTGIVALTPIRYDGQNRIVDADIVFNGRDHAFSTKLAAGRMDVQDVAAHEIGHFIGLDHSPSAGATLFPWVSAAQTVHRSLAVDDARGAQATYTGAGAASGGLSGVVLRSAPGGGAGPPARRAWVAATRADGTSAGGALTKDDGSFVLPALGPGLYALGVAPLDGPMTGANLTSAGAVDTDFGCLVVGTSPSSPTPWPVVAGATTNVGALVVPPKAGPAVTQVSPSAPLYLAPGGSNLVILSGSGLVTGCAVRVPGEGVTVAAVQPTAGFGTLLVTLVASPDAVLGPRDLIVVDPEGRVALESGALEVRKPAPQVSAVAPSLGPSAGGTEITITGSGFATGDLATRVAVGGALAAATVLSATQVQAVVPPLGAGQAPGSFDVVVMNSDAQEGRKEDGFRYVGDPAVTALFPAQGSKAGGKWLRLAGKDFAPGAQVAFEPAGAGAGAAVQAAVTASTTALLDVASPALAAGVYDVRVTNLDGSSALRAGAYESVDAPDLQVSLVAPASAPAGGGDVVSMQGTHFLAGMTVRFGVDPTTGAGGAASGGVTVLSTAEAEVVVPASSGGAGAALLLVEAPGAASALVPGFVYAAGGGGSANGAGGPSKRGGGGGGGGCASTFAVGGPPATPGDTSGALLGLAWLALAAAALWLRARRRSRPVAAGEGLLTPA